MKVLRDLRSQQLAEIKMLNALKARLGARAEGLAEKHEELRDNQEAVVKRVERVLRAMLEQTPMRSDAERIMAKELSGMRDKVKHLNNSMQQVRAKRDYQSSLMVRHETNLKLQKRRTTPNDTQLKKIKEFLAEESQTLTELTEKIKDIQKTLEL